MSQLGTFIEGTGIGYDEWFCIFGRFERLGNDYDGVFLPVGVIDFDYLMARMTYSSSTLSTHASSSKGPLSDSRRAILGKSMWKCIFRWRSQC